MVDAMKLRKHNGYREWPVMVFDALWKKKQFMMLRADV